MAEFEVLAGRFPVFRITPARPTTPARPDQLHFRAADAPG
jgi:hypothetical protein